MIPAPACRAPECADGGPLQRVPGTPHCCLCSGPALAALQACSAQSRKAGRCLASAASGRSSSLGNMSTLRHSLLHSKDTCLCAAGSLQVASLHTGHGHSIAAPAAAQATPPLHHSCTPGPHMLGSAPQARAVTLLIQAPPNQVQKQRHQAARTPSPPAVSVCKRCCRCWAGDWLKPCSSRGGTAGSWWCSSFTPKGPPAICCCGWPASRQVVQRGMMSWGPKVKSGPANSSGCADAGLHCNSLHTLMGCRRHGAAASGSLDILILS